MAFVVTKDDLSNYALEFMEPNEGKTDQDILQLLLQNVEATKAITGHIGGCILRAITTPSGKPAAGLMERWRKDADWESIGVQMMPVLTALGELHDASKTELLFLDMITGTSKSDKPFSLQKDDSIVVQVIDVQPETVDKAVSDQELSLKKQLESSELESFVILKTADASKVVVLEKWSSSAHAKTRASAVSVVELVEKKEIVSATVVKVE